jgi:hypothetical protein
MEKTGDTINQLAIITDLIEKINIDYISAIIVFNLNEKEFENVYNYTVRKHGESFIPLKSDIKDFSLLMGDTKIIFNKNNV